MKKKTTPPRRKTVTAALDQKTVRRIEENFRNLEDAIGGLQQELQETLTYMELRLENLEVVIAEIQSALHRQDKTRDATPRPFSH